MADRGTPPRSFRLDPALVERLREAAGRDNRNMTQAVAEAIELYIRKVDRERGKAE
jgi:predicted DNA-binding protein